MPAPSAPVGLAITAQNGQLTLTWTATAGAITYKVYRGTTPGGESGTAVATGLTSPTYVNTGLTNGTTYYYKVSAVNGSGESTHSSEASSIPINVLPLTNVGVFFSPYNWYQPDGYARTNNPGAYIKFRFTGTSFKLNVDVSANAPLAADDYPTILYRVDDGAWLRRQLASSDAVVTLATGLTSGTHDIVVIFAAVGAGYDRFTTPVASLRVNSFTIAAAATGSAPPLLPKRMIVFSDEQGEGQEVVAVGTADTSKQDASEAFPLLIGTAFCAEVGVIAFTGQGMTTVVASATTHVPTLINSWNAYSTGHSRLDVAGLLSPTPDYILCSVGANDSGGSLTTAVENLVDAWRTAAPSTTIVFMAPSNLSSASSIQAGAASAGVKYTSPGMDLIGDGSGSGAYNNDSRLNLRGQALYAAMHARRIPVASAAG